ncbi:hypothetical protein JP0125_14440 [Helicobacter pylori]|nr:hypothetical protein HPMKF10_1369 [Helicobacter pylori]BAW72600.1 hypothetical protein HPMKF3_1365 [Helicobacter pylori]GHQ42380.1 hypothetical protein JP0067_14960 [Helicobacter pylori]GHQ92787.1 hypothetical protein JP0085_14660 [Helicobacter pylori]GHR39872.1 hypothetical protein JP0097_08400 [Helicobacter pylori]
MVGLSISLNSLKRNFEKSKKLSVLLIWFIPFTNSFFLNVLRYSETLSTNTPNTGIFELV